MKTIFKLSLCAALISGLLISSVAASQNSKASGVSQEDQKTTIKELTIRNSGFRSRATIVIRYRDEDKKIVEVIENGKKLAPSEFSRYESIMRKILELPQIDRLLPDFDRAKRRAESPRISEESKIREMMALRRRLEELDSDVARHYRDLNELQLFSTLNSLTKKIGESSDLTQKEKIQQLKAVIEKINAMQSEKKQKERRTRLEAAEFRAVMNAIQSLIFEIYKSDAISNEDKIKEIQELLLHARAVDLVEEEGRRRNLIEFEAANTIRKILQEIAKNKLISEQQREKEFNRVLQEAKKMNLADIGRTIGIEKFKFELHKLLKKEGLLPEGKAEFTLRLKKCLIDGKKLPDKIHQKILQLCEESIGKKFGRNTKIILRLNEDR